MADNTPGNKMSPSKLVDKVLEASLMVGRGQPALQTTIDQFLAELDQHVADGTTALTERNMSHLRTLSANLQEQSTPPRQTVDETIGGWDSSDQWLPALADIRNNAQNARQTQAEPETVEGQETVAREETTQEAGAADKDDKDKKGKGKKEPALTFSGIMEAAANAGHKAGRELAGTEMEFAIDGTYSEEATAMHNEVSAMLEKVEEKLKGDKDELSEDAAKAMEALEVAAEQVAVHAAEAGKAGEHFLYEAGLNEPELKAVQEAQKVLDAALEGSKKDIKKFAVPTEKFPRTAKVEDVPVKEEKESKDKAEGKDKEGKKAEEAKKDGEETAKAEGAAKDGEETKPETKKEEPGVYANSSALQQARAGGQTISKGAMIGSAALLAAGAGIAVAGMRSGGGNSQQDPRNPNAEQGKKSGGRTLIKATVITMGVAAATLAVASLLRKEPASQTLSTFAARVTGGRLGGGQAAQR